MPEVKAWNQPTTALLGVGGCFFGSLRLAACFSPQPYRWRETVMSALASPKDNPHAFLVACAGVALSALWLLAFPTILRRRLRAFAPEPVDQAGTCLRVGAVFLLLTALVVPGHYRVFGVHRLHEQLARIAAAGLCLALIGYLRAVVHLPRTLRWLQLCALLFVALPVASFLLSRLVLLVAYSFWRVADYQAATVSVWGSLALWEWLGAGSIYLFLAMVTLGVPEARQHGSESQTSPPVPLPTGEMSE